MPMRAQPTPRRPLAPAARRTGSGAARRHARWEPAFSTRRDSMKRMIRSHGRFVLVALTLAVGILLSGLTYLTAHAASQKLANANEHKDMQLVGFNDLQGRSAYQPTIHRYANGRYVAFVGHHGGTSPTVGGSNGTSIVDVTDPSRPVYLFHIPGGSGTGEAGGAQMVRVCDGLGTAGAGHVYMLRATSTSHELYDVTNPAAPAFI